MHTVLRDSVVFANELEQEVFAQHNKKQKVRRGGTRVRKGKSS